MSTHTQPPMANAVLNKLTTDISTYISKELLKVRLESQNSYVRRDRISPNSLFDTKRKIVTLADVQTDLFKIYKDWLAIPTPNQLPGAFSRRPHTQARQSLHSWTPSCAI